MADAKALCMWEHRGDPAGRSEAAKGVRDQRTDGEVGWVAGTSWGIVRTLALTLRSTGSPCSEQRKEVAHVCPFPLASVLALDCRHG